jgi:Nucleotidyl transferase AbiEii toxin, Type IV TA system
VVAEKFEALVTLGMANSRLKDFYDLWLIAQTFELREATLTDAVRRTFKRRGTALAADVPVGLSDAFAAAWATQWRAFLSRERMTAAPDILAIVVADLRLFLMPLLKSTSNDDRVWPPTGPWLQP